MEMTPKELVTGTNVRDYIKEMMDLSRQDGDERGVALIEIDDELYMTQIQRGTDRSLRITYPSVFGLGIFPVGDVVGTIHTHPNESFESHLSFTDIKSLVNSDLEFVVIVFDKDGDVVVDIAMPNKYEDFNHLEDKVGEDKIDLVRLVDMNEAIVEYTINLGKL